MFLITIVIISFLFLYFKFYQYKNDKTLNGLKRVPFVTGGLPIFGHLFNIGERSYEYFTKLSEIYGPIFKIQIGWKEIIVLINNETITKCLKDQGDNFAGRWHNAFTDQLAHYCGVTFTEKEWWTTQKCFTVNVFKNLGFGKSQSENLIIKQIDDIVQKLHSTSGKAISTMNFLYLATTNVICDFTMKKEFKENDFEIIDLMNNIREILQKSDGNSVIVNLFPLFKNFPKVENKIYKLLDKDNVIELFEKVYEFVKKNIKEHKERFDPNNECNDLIDAFLLEQYKLKNSGVVEHSFTEWQLIRLNAELFIAGYETTSTTLTWSFLLLARFSNVQRKIHDEIVAIIGTERYPTMSDKKSLNYCQAAMDEILRFVSTLPLSVPHRVFNDASVNGYFIPKDSIIFTNLYGCHRDRNVWEKPYDFFPEHFLDHDGMYKSRSELIPFGVGKRSCLGESLARNQYFLFLITVIQRFTLSLDEDSQKLDDSILLQGTTGLIRGTVEHKIMFTEILTDEVLN